MLKFLIISFCFLMTVIFMAYGENLRLNIIGLEGKLYQNVCMQLSNIPQSEVVLTSRFRTRITKIIKERLKPLGYYQPTITFSYEEKLPPERSILAAKVSPGVPIAVKSVVVILKGEAKNDYDYVRMIKNNTPKYGRVQNDSEYENFKGKLNSLAIQRGYFDAVLEQSQLGISCDYHSSYWNFIFNSGKRYRFSSISYQGSQISSDYLNNIAPFKCGEYYTSEKLAEFNRRLVKTGWFTSVIVAPNIIKAREENTDLLPIQGMMVPRAKNFVAIGGGYATDAGPRVKATWNKPWVNFFGQSIASSVSFSQSEHSINASYKIPLKTNPLEQYYEIQGRYKRTNLNDTESNTTTLNMSRNWDYSSGWQYAANMRWMFSYFTQADITNITMLVYPGVSFNRVQQRGGMMPTWGDSQRYSIDYSNEIWGSDINFLVLQTKHVWIRTLSKGHRLILRGHLGWIKTDNFDKVPPDLRFFAGGDGSIRGYGYQKVSPEDIKGKLTGASKLVVGSIEYQYNVTGNWWWATFISSGEVVNNIKMNDFKTGAGVGIRWVSPVGPIKFDIATPIKESYNNIQFYIGLGTEL
ncbi:Translocation and assembly module subunit TamA [Candidatus Hartigia pinicola]|nr:Translocation and assembly module subunit TamA [Candidatus Hartigia pinicola]